MKLLAYTPLSIAAYAGRTAWQSFHKGGLYKSPTDNITEEDFKFLDRLFNKYKHLSVAEHLKYTLFMTKEEYADFEYIDDGYLRKGFRNIDDGIIFDREYFINIDIRWLIEHKDFEGIEKIVKLLPVNHQNLFYGKEYQNELMLEQNFQKVETNYVDLLYIHYSKEIPYNNLNISNHLIFVTLKFKNISRALLQELMRHDDYIAATIKSTRYTLKELKNEQEFIWQAPIDHGRIINRFDFERAKKYVKLTDDELTNKVIVTELEDLRKLLLSGRSNDIAKFALPEAYLTEGVLTIPLRNLDNMIKLRDSKDALWEFQEVAKDLRKIRNTMKERYGI